MLDAYLRIKNNCPKKKKREKKKKIKTTYLACQSLGAVAQ